MRSSGSATAPDGDAARLLGALGPISPAALQAWCAICTPRNFAKGEFLLRAGERAEWGFVLRSGLVREFYVAESGIEHTRSFIAEGQVTGSLLDLLSDGAAVTWIEALEPTVSIAFRYAEFVGLYPRFRELESIARRNSERLYVLKARREHDMLALSAGVRYERWLAEHAAIDPRVTRRHLAAYLGITPEHLSRLRQSAHQRPTPREPKR